MKWLVFKNKIKLDRRQSGKIKEILKSFRKQYTEICLLNSVESLKSPVEYAAELKTTSPHLDNDDFNEKFIGFMKKERIPVCNLTYVEASLQSDLLARAKINQLLNDKQKGIFQTLKIESMLDIDIGYYPFDKMITGEIAKRQEVDAGKNDNVLLSKTFCIMPWIHMFVEAGGSVKLCCTSRESMSNGPSFSLQNQPLRDIWNSAGMREVRRKMLAGEIIGACSTCDNDAEISRTSGRIFFNNYWLEEDTDREKWLERVRCSVRDNYEVKSLPVYYDLRTGNTCNLKCRMCNADCSSSVRNDAIHSTWAPVSEVTGESRFPGGMKWYESDSIMVELLEGIQEIRLLYLSGGEPLINPFNIKLVDILIKRKASRKIDLQFSTNLTVFPEKLFKRLARFKSVKLYISIDGLGPIYEYLRYPAKWESVANNLKHLGGYANFSCVIRPTIQNCNILSIIDLLDFAGSLHMPCSFNILHTPHFLSVRAMPGKARILAITRLLEYMEKSSLVKTSPDMAASINSIIMELKQNPQSPYPDTMAKFIMFFNELDRSRGQSFKDSVPELYHFIVEDGFQWITDQVLAFPDREKPSHILSLSEKIGNGKNIQWDGLRKKLKLSRSKSIQLVKVLNSGKDRFTEICLRPADNKSKSPIEFAAELQMSRNTLDQDEFKKYYNYYLCEKKDPITNLTYVEAGEQVDQSIRKRINEILSEKEKQILGSLEVGNFLYMDTGYQPLEEKVTEKIKEIRINRIAEIKDNKYKEFFCPLPFEYITICDNGDVYLCSACKMRSSVGNLAHGSLEEIWNSDLAAKTREAVLEGSYKFCNQNECEYLQDLTLQKTEEVSDEFYKNIISKRITVMETAPRIIEVSYDKSCNLACHYCRSEHIVSKGNEMKRLRKIHGKTLKNELKGVRRLMLSGCGDPLASRLHKDFLQTLDQGLYPDVRIKIQTNGLLLTPVNWDSISSSHYAIDWISISIDAATKETYKINRGGNFSTLLKNLEFVSTLRKNSVIEAFNINFVVQANNFREMKRFIDLGKKFGCDYIVFQRIMNLGIDYGLYSEEQYQGVAIHLESHPEHAGFLEVLNDPIFLDPRIGLFKLLEFFPEEMRKQKDVDSIIKYYPECERGRLYR